MYLTLDEATTKLRELGEGAGLTSARWLVLRLDEPGETTLGVPQLRCSARCEVTPRKLRREQGCVCAQTALGQRLWDRAFPDVAPGLASDARKRRYQKRCPACRIPFVTGEKGRQYCNGCTTHGKEATT